MEINLQYEDLLIKLRAKLNEQKIKLWEPPYYDVNNEFTDDLKNLAEDYGLTFSIATDSILEGLKELQKHSLERVVAQSQFNESGLATVRVRTPDRKVVSCRILLTDAGSSLIQHVAADINISPIRIKLIFNGKVVKQELKLEDQGIKNGSQLMAIFMTDNPHEVVKEDQMYLEMKATKDDATMLSRVNDLSGEEYLKLEDQWGRPVPVQPHVRRALLVAMTLHARAKAAMKEHNYSLALVLLLEADQHFSECDDMILSVVDNFGVLQLDIAWCYLCLQNLTAASDVSRRLNVAEGAFKKSYGDNMERLIAVKGTAANERVLIMRLYLLQGIVAYYQNRRDEAGLLFYQAETELNSLRVDETSVLSLMELGWSRNEATRVLRASGGDVTLAANSLQAEADLKREKLEKEKQQRKLRALGLCKDGKRVDMTLVAQLKEMGFSHSRCVASLSRTNNDITQAVSLIQEQADTFSDDSDTPDDSDNMMYNAAEVDQILLTELKAMGYNAERSRKALRKCRNELSKAIEFLSTMPDNLSDVSTSSDVPLSSDVPTTSAAALKKVVKKMKKSAEHEKALARLTSSIKGEENEHLNTDLQQEEQFLVQYKSLL